MAGLSIRSRADTGSAGARNAAADVSDNSRASVTDVAIAAIDRSDLKCHNENIRLKSQFHVLPGKNAW